MPNLYGQQPGGAGSSALYGQGQSSVLSTRNQAQAQQLGLPEAVGQPQGPAGSQIEANDPFANFETIFNENRGNAQKEAGALAGRVKATAGEQSGLDNYNFAGARPQAPSQARQPPTPPVAPTNGPIAAVQAAPDLNSKQAAADHTSDAILGQYGQEAAPQSSGLQQVGGNGGTTKLGGGAPVAQQSADTASGKGSAKGAGANIRPQVQVDANGNPINPFDQPTAASQGIQYDTPHPNDPNDTNGDGYVSQIEQDQANARAAATKAQGGGKGSAKAGTLPAPMQYQAPDVNPTADELGRLKRLSDTNDLLGSWGTDGGQQLLKDQYGDATSWDAAIESAGGGRAAFDQLNQKYGGQDMKYAHQLANDVNERRRQAQAVNEANATNQANWAAQQNQGPADQGSQTWHPPDYNSLQAFMDQGSAGQYAHEGAMDASPADWITRGLGEAGAYNGQNASQVFAGMFGANGNQANGMGDWQVGNLRAAARLVQNEYGQNAMNYWFQHLTPEMWQAYMQYGNAGAMARDMRAWLESAGFHKGGQ